MDIKTLSQQLNMPIRELRAKMRREGFDVSPRAKKINNNVAREVINRLSEDGEQQPDEEEKQEAPKKVEVPRLISVKEFAVLLDQPVTAVIKSLIENGVMATINEEIDADTAAIIGEEFNAEVVLQKKQDSGRLGLEDVRKIMAEEGGELTERSPVVAVMGHVDHGKTTLLDTIRKTNIAGGESGAITQHIGAYQITLTNADQARTSTDKREKKITFLDTPGHEAFAAMRARGANVTDVIVLVVAADDGVKPQTVEVINRAKLTKTPLVVAVNKIDLPGANPDRVKGDLAEVGVTVEDWGGDVPAVPISAKTGEGIDKLLEIIILTAEMLELKASTSGQTLGVVIESHLSRGQGPVATVLIKNGILKVGDSVSVGSAAGKVRSMENALGVKQKQAGPSVPVRISGLGGVPEVGDILKTAPTLEEAKSHARELQKIERAKKLRSRSAIKADPDSQELNLILRADVQGSLEAIVDELSKISSEDVKMKIVDQGVGEVTDSDVQLAANTGSTIIAFQSRVSSQAQALAKRKEVIIDQYEVIYELISDVTEALIAMMPIDTIETELGRAKIKAIFRTEKQEMIVGGEVASGKIVDKKKFKILRDGEEIGSGKIEELQQNKVEVNEVSEGKEFGCKVRIDDIKVEEGDVLQVYDETVKKRTLSQ